MVDISVLEKLSLFSKCNQEELKSLSTCFSKVHYSKNQTIYCEKEESKAVYIILEGEVELNVVVEEKFMHIGRLIEGDIFGTGEMFFDQYYINSVSLKKTELIRIGKKEFFSCFLKIPSLSMRILQDFAWLARGGVVILHLQSGFNKIIYFINFVAKEFGHTVGDKIISKKYCSYEQVAHRLSLTREYVTKVFHKLESDGVIEMSKAGLKIDKKWLASVIDDSIANNANYVFR